MFVASALALLLVGCVDAPAPVVPPEPEYVSTWVEPEPTAIAPLRGTLIEAGAATNPSIAAKIARANAAIASASSSDPRRI